MNASNYFYGLCPKCNEINKLVITSWNELNNKFSIGDKFDVEASHEVSLSICCDKCKKASSGMTHYDYDGPDMGPLNHYGDATGNISESLKSILQHIVYDVPPLRTNSSLLAEAQKIVEMRMWSSVVIICRKIIDVKTAKIWEEKYHNEQLPEKLKTRIDKLYPEKDERNGKAKVYHRAHAIRLDGNTAAHKEEQFNESEAVDILSFTKWFCDATGSDSGADQDALR
ncbi:DUF4145 domain-containing protein [Pantoea sp. 1.19]|uniref:DUF4145 domain-containing protein n=1 Tax=Pantoea sp. 1.19 TaxID=1925589 RepID=UPI0009FB38FC|nr:DUF4145 domain-containing protein [Pantoea sp. 1.19]